MSFRKIGIEDFNENAFKLLSKDWLLVTAKANGDTNTMTIGWGGFGVMWGKNVAFIVIRPERYTYGLVEKADKFSLTAFDESFRKELTYCGRNSGRDGDKITACNFTLNDNDGVPYFEEARLVINCKKLYADMLKADCFLDNGEAMEKHYTTHGGLHKLYIAEIESIFVKED